jgi:hypothetical protein
VLGEPEPGPSGKYPFKPDAEAVFSQHVHDLCIPHDPGNHAYNLAVVVLKACFYSSPSVMGDPKEIHRSNSFIGTGSSSFFRENRIIKLRKLKRDRGRLLLTASPSGKVESLLVQD